MESSGKKLSRAVLDLKFMKKSKEKAEVQEENEERQKLYQDQLSSLHEGADRIMRVPSYVDCMDFLPCRLSFGGMDIDIEKLNEDKLFGVYKKSQPKKKYDIVRDGGMDVDVSAEDIAQNHSTLLGNKAQKLLKRKSTDFTHEDNEGESTERVKNEEMEEEEEMINRGRHLLNAFDKDGQRNRNFNRGGQMNRGFNRGQRNFRGRGNFNNRGRDNPAIKKPKMES